MQNVHVSAEYWDQTLESFHDDGEGGSWRAFCDSLHRKWIEDQLEGASFERVLKTDLFDEAAGLGLFAALKSLGKQVHGIDIAAQICKTASGKQKAGRFIAAGVKQLPYRDESFDLIVSNSTLDHFTESVDIVHSLGELYRVLRPGGRMLISLDNEGNPLIALRRALPYEFLHSIGLVPYFVGKSATGDGMTELLKRCGFQVSSVGTLMHVPRVLAIPVCHMADRIAPGMAAKLVSAMESLEALGKLPSRNRTGFFVTALAVKP